MIDEIKNTNLKFTEDEKNEFGHGWRSHKDIFLLKRYTYGKSGEQAGHIHYIIGKQLNIFAGEYIGEYMVSYGWTYYYNDKPIYKSTVYIDGSEIEVKDFVTYNAKHRGLEKVLKHEYTMQNQSIYIVVNETGDREIHCDKWIRKDRNNLLKGKIVYNENSVRFEEYAA